MDDAYNEPEFAGEPGGVRLGIIVGLTAVAIVAVIAGGRLLQDRPVPPPDAVGGLVPGDPEALIDAGKALFEWQCASCHGKSGSGDGPIADGLAGPGPGDLTDDDWKHGDRPDQVLGVIADGVDGTSMAAWGSTFDADELHALAAYTYHLAGREVPDGLLGPAH